MACKASLLLANVFDSFLSLVGTIVSNPGCILRPSQWQEKISRAENHDTVVSYLIQFVLRPSLYGGRPFHSFSGSLTGRWHSRSILMPSFGVSAHPLGSKTTVASPGEAPRDPVSCSKNFSSWAAVLKTLPTDPYGTISYGSDFFDEICLMFSNVFNLDSQIQRETTELSLAKFRGGIWSAGRGMRRGQADCV